MNNYPELIRRVKKLNYPGHRLNNTDTATLSIAVDAIAALEAENAKLRDPWVRIDPERPETLPAKNGFECLLSIHITDDPFTDDYDEVVPAYSNNGMWEVDGPYGEIEPLERVMGRGSRRVTAVAWQPWPPPYGVNE